MSSSTTSAPAPRSTIYLGLDVRKDSITIAVLPDAANRMGDHFGREAMSAVEAGTIR